MSSMGPVPGHIILIGPMCAGKSTVGKRLAAVLGIPFVDLDRQVEAMVGPLLPFFQQQGEQAFRTIESKVLAEVLDGPRSVIATGGGTPFHGDNLTWMERSGALFHLHVPLDVLLGRVQRSGLDRPLLHGLSGEALQARVAELLEERASGYASARFQVDASGDPSVVTERIMAILAQVK
ncbi:MAG: shikimate kinase [Flavobacteriales bacterium]|nr:shikimate kinase [Flavobacteriales bacterium]